ncbi:MAG: hypothetical protein M1822_001675 [Bathelium mastoideum]|nr:MAG: hypothetical protein M1822_001675 [Bathelium mastoideum]
MSASLSTRDISGDVNGVKHTFSGWDSCMQKAYCKWPVIVAIIIGSLIVLSVLFCVARCLCCGAECACCCFRCCTDCCRSSGRSNRRNNAYAPAPQPAYQQPQPYSTPYSSAAPPTYSTKPQFARFDASKKGGVGGRDADSLPAMPSWDDATSHKVEVEEEEELEGTEMQHLDPHNNTPGAHSPQYPAAAAMPGYAADNNHPTSSSNLSYPPSSQANPYGANASQSSPYRTTSPPYHAQQHYSPPVSPPAQHGYASPPPQLQPGYADSSYGYAPSGSTRYEPSGAYAPPQYQAYGGGTATNGSGAGIERKPVQGSWRDI